MNGSVTTSGRDSPNFVNISAIRRTEPPPTCSTRGAAMLALTVVMMGSSLKRLSSRDIDLRTPFRIQREPLRRDWRDVARLDHLANRRQVFGTMTRCDMALA